MSDPLLGRILGGRYRIERLLGAGGMGAVYEATQVDIRRRVALKVLRAGVATPDQRARFEREARALSQVNSPHVVEIRDFQVLPDEPPLLVMEFLEGTSLSGIVKDEGVLAPERVAKIALQMLAGLAEAHRQRIVHRDVKPANVVLVPSPALGEIVKIVDFGVSTADVTQIPRTLGTAFVGTLSYMAPEQALGDAVDGRADVYGVGGTMYYALSKRRPIEAESATAAVDLLIRSRVAKLGTHRPDLDPELAAIVDRALEREPAARWASAEQMAGALRAWLEARAKAPIVPPAPTIPVEIVAPPPVPARPARRPWFVAALAVVLLALGLVAFVFALTRRTPPPPASSATFDAGGPAVSVAAAPVISASGDPVRVEPQLITMPSAPPPAAHGALARGGTSSNAYPADRAAASPSGAVDDLRWTGRTCKGSLHCEGNGWCEQGRCLCSISEIWCKGECMARDADNCAGCGKRCPQGLVCAAPDDPRFVRCATCSEVARAQGLPAGRLKLCPGTEVCVDVSTNLFHCGECGHTCDPAKHESCQSGKCVALYR